MADAEYRGLIHRNNADLAAWLAKRPLEKALEPDLPIIDPHHHLWDAPQSDPGDDTRRSFASCLCGVDTIRVQARSSLISSQASWC